ncbi:hypothetical protein ACTHGU_14195 [Chitinophagaceae bacterium MMS25-I14]
MAENITIQKNPQLLPAADYAFLRQKGMEYIEMLGSSIWTDYNIHDPGITLMELLCYALTDLGYRTSFDIKDILAAPPGTKPDPLREAFFTAREILTTNPWTTPDYRKLLIDIDGIRNGWMYCKSCPCDDMCLYANCAKSELQYWPKTEHQIIIKGMYDVLIAFEDDNRLGNLNTGKIKYNFSFPTDAPVNKKYTIAVIEIRLPSWHDIEENKTKFASFRKPTSKVKTVTVQFISGDKSDNTDVPADQQASVLRRPVYATLSVEFWPDKKTSPATEILQLDDVPLTVWFRSDADRKSMQLQDLKNAIQDATASGILAKYLDKVKKTDVVMADTKQVLQSHRNLCEDYCSIKAIEVEDIAICADMDVTPDADIEKVLAQAYYLIDQYMSPDIRFHSLKELMDAGTPVDEIFDGPQLNNGFINNDELESTQLKTELHTSDIINLLMDIPGVVAIRNFTLVRYDKDGNRVESQPWVLPVTYNHEPRLYVEGSKFLVFKNGLPFLPDRLELADTMQVIRGQNAQSKFSIADDDLPVPAGTYYQLDAYYPLQYSLPLTYGVGKDGLPPHVTEERRAQAKQLKGYLLFFEQMLVNYLQQLRHVNDLFAVDDTVTHTYFSTLLSNSDIEGISEMYAPVNGSPIDQATLDGLAETNAEFLDRRNRFLDHLLARFAEQFTDYTLMLYAYTDNQKISDEMLISDKVVFLKEYPFMSRNKARSFNYKDPTTVCSNENIAGLKKRIELLLGFKGLSKYWQLYEEHDNDGISFEQRWRLVDDNGKILLSSSTRYVDADQVKADAKAEAEIDNVLKYVADPAMYEIKKSKQWVLNLKDPTGEVIATRKQHFSKKTDAEAARDAIVDFAKKKLLGEQIYVVEHLLLRPRNKPAYGLPDGDPLLSICIPANCQACGEEDPYSFRMTIVMNGETGMVNSGMEFRRFAEETIRMEIPAHLGLKICWVSGEQLAAFGELYCAWLTELAKEEPDRIILSNLLRKLLAEFVQLKSVYPPASLHDCVDGNDENRVYLNQTII